MIRKSSASPSGVRVAPKSFAVLRTSEARRLRTKLASTVAWAEPTSATESAPCSATAALTFAMTASSAMPTGTSSPSTIAA
ncbi:hypothetical protein D3C87_1681990 [compost metagenome]